MATFGNNVTGTTPVDNPSNNFIWVKALSTPASNGTLTDITIYCQIRAGTPILGVALYTDVAGAPGALIAANDSGGSPAAGFGAVASSLSTAITASTQYWFCFRCPGNIGGATPDVNIYAPGNGGALTAYFLNNAAGATFPAVAAGLSTAAGEDFAVWGTYTPDGGAPFVGSTTMTLARPRARVETASPNLLTTTLAPASAATPFAAPLFPVIRPTRRLDVGFLSAFVIDDNAPFTSAIWTLPARPVRRVNVDPPNLLTTTLAGVVDAPFVGLQSPLVRPTVRRVEFFGPNLLITTLAPVAPMPFAGLPALLVRPVARRFSLDPTNLLVTLYGPVAPPFVQMMTTLTYTRARQVAPVSVANLLETTLAPVGTFRPAWAGNSNTAVGF